MTLWLLLPVALGSELHSSLCTVGKSAWLPIVIFEKKVSRNLTISECNIFLLKIALCLFWYFLTSTWKWRGIRLTNSGVTLQMFPNYEQTLQGFWCSQQGWVHFKSMVLKKHDETFQAPIHAWCGPWRIHYWQK